VWQPDRSEGFYQLTSLRSCRNVKLCDCMGFIVGVSSLGFTVVPAFQWRSQDFYAFGRCCCPRTFIGSAHKQVPVAPEHRRTMHSDAGVAARGRFIFVL